jgi:chitodextrinase
MKFTNTGVVALRMLGVCTVCAAVCAADVAPVTVHNPWITNDRVADCRTLASMAATFDEAHTPDGVVTPSPTDYQTRAINEYNNFKRRLYHWGEMPPNNRDVVEQLNVFGWALCGSQASMNSAILNPAGIHARTISIPGHTIYEVEYGGKWHCLDTMTTYYVYNRATPPIIASMADVKADHTLVLNAVAEGRACPGFLLCGDTPEFFATGSDSWSVLGDPGSATTTKSMNLDLRLGESLKRTCESWANQWPSTSSSPPYHHEASGDYKDTVNILYWEPYKLTTAQNSAIGISYSTTYRRWANGAYELKPDFTTAAYQASLLSSANIATFHDDGLTPDLHVATPGSLASAVFQITTPYYITDLNISGTFYKNAAGDINRIYVSSTSGTSGFTKIWDNAVTGTTTLTNLNARAYAYCKYSIWVKVELQGTAAKTDAGVSDLVISPIFEHNKGGMPYLDKGINNLTLTFDNPAELQASGNVIHVVYKWKEFAATDWTVDKQYEGWFAASPAGFTINAGGTKVPRTEYILMEVTPAPYDPIPPGQVTGLALNGTPGSGRVPLTWVASGDDGSTGTAMAYDLRYSTSPITDDATFNAATKVNNVPAPQVSGSTETFTVLYLQGSTTYWFAIKAVDKGNNTSPLSNVITTTTPAAAYITDLDHGAVGFNKAVLTWTAIDDGSLGTFASYDLRYSTSPISDDTSFNAAAQATGEPTPKAPGGAETFTLTGLAGSTTYWIAIKAVDYGGNRSPLSNVLELTTAPPDLTAPQWIGDLKGLPSKTAKSVDLTWTAPTDYGAGGSGPFAAAAYNLRYSASPITEANFAAATPVAGLAAPKAPGQTETFTVTLPAANTTYYFAIKSSDEGSPANVSEISNCAPTKTSVYGEKILQRGLNGYTGTRDAYIIGLGGGTNSDKLAICGYADSGVNNIMRAFVRFDLASVPGDMIVRQATFSIYAWDAAGLRGSTGFYNIQPLTRDWSETQITWALASTGVSWTTPGGDFLSTPDGSSPKQSVVNVWYPFDCTARVQSWLAGTSTNYGWCVKVDNENRHNQDRFYSGDSGNSTYRPKLVLSDLATPVTGDVDGDSHVDVTDVLYLAGSFGGICGTDRAYDPRCDFNADHCVDVSDLLILAASWGT